MSLQRLLSVLALQALLAAGCAAGANRVQAYNDFALAMARRGLWEESLMRWEQALRLAPDDARILNNIAVAYEARGRLGDAVNAYRRAVALDKGNALYQHNLRRCERNQQRSRRVQGEPLEEEVLPGYIPGPGELPDEH
jgi:Flp pilus assembly protein TadD